MATALNSNTAIHVASLLDSLDTSSRHSSLKSLLLITNDLSEDAHAQQFFDLNDHGDRQPLEVIGYMIRLHASKMPGFLLKFASKWLLPPAVCHAISTFPSKDLRASGHKADCLMVNFKDQRSVLVSSVGSLGENSPVHPTSSPLMVQVQTFLLFLLMPMCQPLHTKEAFLLMS